MKLLVYGAGVCGSLFAARLHETGHDVSLLARGGRLTALRQHGVQLAEGDSPAVRRVPVRDDQAAFLTAAVGNRHRAPDSGFGTGLIPASGVVPVTGTVRPTTTARRVSASITT